MENNKKKRIAIAAKVGIISVCVIFSTIFISGSVNNSYAAKNTTISPKEISVFKQNALYKAVYSNLIKCYAEMNQKLNRSSINTYEGYDSGTYFSGTALKKDFVKYPFDGGDKHQSSCPGMIMGWSNNWFTNFFTGTGNFAGLSGIKKDAVVPESGDKDIDKVTKFLEGIGYKKGNVPIKQFANKKCFYLNVTLDERAVEETFGSLAYGKPKGNFSTPDYCYSVDGSGKVKKEKPIVLDGKQYADTDSLLEVDATTNIGHLTRDSQTLKMQFDNVSYPFYSNYDPELFGVLFTPEYDKGSYFDANIDLVKFKYKTDINGTIEENVSIAAVNEESTTAKCISRGFINCGKIGSWKYASLTNANELITYESLKQGLVKILNNLRTAEGDKVLFGTVNIKDYELGDVKYTKDASSNKYIEYFIGNTNDYNDGVYSDAENYILYWDYLKDHYKVQVIDRKVEGAEEVSWLKDDGTFAKSYILSNAGEKDKKYILDKGKWNPTDSNLRGWREIAKLLGKIDTEKAFAVKAKNIVDSSADPANAEDTESGSDKLQEACFRNAGSMGWVICPTIFGLRSFGESIYKFVEPILQVNDSIVSQLGKQDSSIFKAWNTFRNFANVVFAMFFLIVIFSQLTGYGIDNYGIKKALPKLMVAVILVNLSFIICAIAVDISNIVGSSIKSLFENLGGDQLGGNAVGANSRIIEKILNFLLLAGSTVGAGAAAFALSGWAILIPILLFFLTTAISILFAFIVLGMRQALIIVLIVSAPIAIVLSGFPNTKTIYNKWFGLFKGVLMVYPIIGLLVGAGYFTATVIYGDNNGEKPSDFLMATISGLLSVIPYFMIPSLTRKSLDAVGSLGTKINGFGNKFGQGAKGRINNLQPIKDVKSNSIASRARARATKFMTSDKAREIENDIKNGKKVSLRRANKYARAAELASTDRNAILAARVAESKYNRLQSGSGFNAALASAADAEDATEVKNYETLIRNGEFIDSNGERVEYQSAAAIESALQQELMKEEGSVDTKKIRALQNILASKGDDGRNRIYSAMENAQKNGSVSKNAIKAFSSNIMNNQGDYKNQHRSLYEFAKATAADGANNTAKHDGKSDISSFRTDGIQALTADSFLSADSSQIEAYRKAYKDDKLSAEDRAKLEQVAHSIANNRDVHSKIRTDDYGRALSTFASDVDWDAVYSGDSLKVPHSGDNNGGGNGGGSGGNGGNGGNGGGNGNNGGGNSGGSGNNNGGGNGGNGGGNGDGDNNGPPIPPDVPPPEWRNQP